MAALSNYAENALIDLVFRNQTPTLPANWYFALYTAAPGDGGGGTEVSAAGYARVSVARSLSNFAGTQGAGTTAASTGSSGTTSNNVAITFGSPTADWGVITAFGVFDEATNGNMWIHGSLSQAKTVNNGDAAPSFAITDFQFQMDN